MAVDRNVKPLQSALREWYRRARRDLPWRATRDPYAVWISEAMLQQTRVETVLDYWPRFLERFPSLDELATATEAEVVAAWSGLGYYRRARALHRAARAIVERHGGKFPEDLDAALALPGVGPYTAGAVLSIAFDRREAAVDGNVVRVLSRLERIPHAAGTPASQRECWRLAREWLPFDSSPGEWNQAWMELGATLCTPRRPACPACPIRAHCGGHAAGDAELFPRPKSRPQPVEVELEILVVRDGARLLFERRSDDAERMAGLWELPTRESGRPSGLFPPHWRPADAFEPGRELARLRHAITRHRIQASVREARARDAGRLPAAWRWLEVREARALGLTGMARKSLAAIGDG